MEQIQIGKELFSILRTIWYNRGPAVVKWNIPLKNNYTLLFKTGTDSSMQQIIFISKNCYNREGLLL